MIGVAALVCFASTYVAVLPAMTATMTHRDAWWLFTCAPLVLTLAGWARVLWVWRERRLDSWGLTALIIATANAALAAAYAGYYRFKPSSLPPWKDPQTLALGTFFITAPLAMTVGFVAVAFKASKWLIAIVEISSLPLLVVGLYAAASV
jgi:hypothetical protein